MESVLAAIRGVAGSVRDAIVPNESITEIEPCPDCMSIFKTPDAAKKLERRPLPLDLVYGEVKTEYRTRPPPPSERIEHTRKFHNLRATSAAGCPLCNHLLNLVDPFVMSRTNVKAHVRVSTTTSFPFFGFLDNEDDDIVFYITRLGFFDSVIEISAAKLSHMLVEATSPFRQFLWFHAFTESDDAASAYIRGRPLPRNFASAAAFRVIRDRLATSTKMNEETEIPLPHLPRRVIEILSIGVSGHLQLKLRVNDSEVKLRPKDKYAALSYCWGGPQPCTTTIGTEGTHSMGINIADLPRTIADAVWCSRELGLKYLWVDALCILQDSPEDKETEISQMSEIYGNSYITIQAANAASCHDGLYRGVGRLPSPIPLDFLCPSGNVGTISLKLLRSVIPSYTMAKNPIDYRGWTYQESLLAPRLLVYSSYQLFLKTPVHFESFGSPLSWREYAMQTGTTDVSYVNAILHATRNDGEVDSAPTHSLDSMEVRKFWKILVSDYSQRLISEPHDKLLALSAIASRFHDELGDTYLAGCWRNGLIHDLAWVVQHHVVPSRKPKEYRAPSWSWASIDGCIFHADSRLDFGGPGWIFEPDKNIDIIECSVTPLSARLPFGRVSRGKLVIRGHMMQIPKMTNYIYCSSMHFLAQIRGSAEFAVDEYVTNTGSSIDLPMVLAKIFWDVEYGILNKIEDCYTSEPRWCLLLGEMTQVDVISERDKKACGLVLSKQKDGTFRRIGWFLGEGMDNTFGPFDSFDILSYFQKCPIEKITVL